MIQLPPQPTVVLAYSGGLDTSIIVPWLKEEYGARVHCLVADVGQNEELESLPEKALRSGAAACRIVDLRASFVTEYIWPTLRAGAVYARKYLLGTSMARPLIAKAQAEYALSVGADALAHGCTGKGNDQVRFELSYAAFAPHLPVIAPWREWSIESREEALLCAAEHGVPVDASPDKIYSRDGNLWHLSHEGGPLEDPDFEPPADLFMLTTAPEETPDTPEYVTIEFEGGYPVGVNGELLDPVALVTKLNAIAGAHGVGRADIVEDRLVGMKSRGVYETPGGTLLYTALRELESLVLDRRSLCFKDEIASRYADLVYEGRWWSAEREAMDAMSDSFLGLATGTVRLKLYKGSLSIAGRCSTNTLYETGLASFGASDVYAHGDAAGFIKLFGLPTRVAATRDMLTQAVSGTGAVDASGVPEVLGSPLDGST
jgi:argininosuccinate synthase